MSQFLAKIHFLMYEKIQFQEALCRSLIDATPEMIRPDVEAQADAYGEIETAPLEEIIDEGNIHGWLQERVVLSEQRLAAVVKALLDAGFTEEQLMERFRHMGKSLNFKGNAVEAYQQMTGLFLDGMPCDRAIGLLVHDEDKVVFKIMQDVHAPYWEENQELYWKLRGAFMEGLLKQTPYHLYEGEEAYEIR